MLKTNFVAGDKILAADMNATNTDVNTLMSMKGRVELRPVEELPATGETGIIYLVPNGGTGTNTRDEYVWSENAWEKIGTTEIDLSEYAKKSDVAKVHHFLKNGNESTFNGVGISSGSSGKYFPINLLDYIKCGDVIEFDGFSTPVSIVKNSDDTYILPSYYVEATSGGSAMYPSFSLLISGTLTKVYGFRCKNGESVIKTSAV